MWNSDQDLPFCEWQTEPNQDAIGAYLGVWSGKWYERYGVIVDCERNEADYSPLLPLQWEQPVQRSFGDDTALEVGGVYGELDWDGVWEKLPDVAEMSGWIIAPDSQGTLFVLVLARSRAAQMLELRQLLLPTANLRVGWAELDQQSVTCHGFLHLLAG